MLEWGRLMPSYPLGARAVASPSIRPLSCDMVLFWSSVRRRLIAVAGCGFLLAATFWWHARQRDPAAALRAVVEPRHRPQAAARRRARTTRQPRLILQPGLSGPIQVVFGAGSHRWRGRGGRASAENTGPQASDLDLVIDAKVHGLNRKVSNLVNMTPASVTTSSSSPTATCGSAPGYLLALSRHWMSPASAL